MNPLALVGFEIKALAKLGGPRDIFQRIGTNQYGVTYGGFLDGRGLVHQSAAPDYERLAGDPLHNAVVAACVAAIAKALPDAPLILEQREGTEWKMVPDHECLEPLRAPNEDHSDADIWALTSGFKATKGQAFWLVIPDAGGRAREIHVWNPDRVEVLGEESKFISGYRLKREGGGVITPDYPKNQIIHFRQMPDFLNPRVGWNPIGTARAQIGGDNIAATYHTGILFNAGVISLLISLKEGAALGQVTPEQFKTVLENIRKATRERAGGVEGLNVPLEVQKLAYSPAEMNVDSLIEGYERRICSMMGVSQRIAGLGADPTYNNLAEALNDFWERRIVPDRNSDAATLNRQWLPLWEMDPNEWRFRFDYSNVPALQENKDEMHKRVREDFKTGLLDGKQARSLVGYSFASEAEEKVFEGVFYAPPKNAAKLSGGDAPEVKTFDPNQPREEDGKWTSGGDGSFDKAHRWTGGALPETESKVFQDGKAKALEDLLPYTKPGSLEAATIVLKRDGSRFGGIATGKHEDVDVSAPMNVPVALLHTHDYDGPHSEGDWASLIVNRGIEQSHVVTANKTYSLHKPPGWNAADHGLPELLPSDGQPEYDAKMTAAENAFGEVWSHQFMSTPGFGNAGWEQKIYLQAGQEMARKLGIILRTGER